MKENSKLYFNIIISLTLFFGIISITEFIFFNCFQTWTFNQNFLILSNQLFSTFSNCSFIFCLFLIFIKNKFILYSVGVLLVLFFLFNTILTINPIDTTTLPIDINTIEKLGTDKKRIIREYKNAKTNEKIIDTVIVKDIYIFRKICK